MIPSGKPSESPAYTLGSNPRLLLRSLVLFAVTFGIFLELVHLSPMYQSSGSSNLYFTVSPGMAGVYQVVFLIDTFVMLGTGMVLLLTGIGHLVIGKMLFYDDHVFWIRPGRNRTLQYDELTDAYFGWIGAPSGNINPGQASYSFGRRISFYVGNRRLSFGVSMSKHEGIDKYLESRIPKQNIDVEDDE